MKMWASFLLFVLLFILAGSPFSCTSALRPSYLKASRDSDFKVHLLVWNPLCVCWSGDVL